MPDFVKGGAREGQPLASPLRRARCTAPKWMARDLWLALIRVAGAAPFLLRGEGVEEAPRHKKGVQGK